MKERILKLISIEQMTAAKFADVIGVQRSNVSHILSGRNNPSLDFIQKILSSFPNVSIEWLISGKGKMYKKESSPNELFAEPVAANATTTNSSNQSQNSNDIEQIPQNSSNFKQETEEPRKQEINTSFFPQFNESKSIERIIVFYKDRTFHEYTPSE